MLFTRAIVLLLVLLRCVIYRRLHAEICDIDKTKHVCQLSSPYLSCSSTCLHLRNISCAPRPTVCCSPGLLIIASRSYSYCTEPVALSRISPMWYNNKLRHFYWSLSRVADSSPVAPGSPVTVCGGHAPRLPV